MFIKFLVRRKRRYVVNDDIVEEQVLGRFDSYEEAENYILNYDFPTTSEVLELSINKIYTNYR